VQRGPWPPLHDCIPGCFFDVVRSWCLREHKMQGNERKMSLVRASCTQRPHADAYQ